MIETVPYFSFLFSVLISRPLLLHLIFLFCSCCLPILLFCLSFRLPLLLSSPPHPLCAFLFNLSCLLFFSLTLPRSLFSHVLSVPVCVFACVSSVSCWFRLDSSSMSMCLWHFPIVSSSRSFVHPPPNCNVMLSIDHGVTHSGWNRLFCAAT
jgi:hypothetical protein